MAETPTITKLTELTRLYTDEPSITAKYDDDQLMGIIESLTQMIIADVNCTSDVNLKVRHNLTLSSTSQSYLLPPNVERIEEIAKIDSTTDRPLWTLDWRNNHNLRGPVLRVEGRVLRLDPAWQGLSETVRITYVPNGDFKWHYGDAGTITTTTVVLAATPTVGELDTRENGYVGAVLRILTDPTNGYVQERTVTAYDRSTRVATVDPPFSPLPAPSGAPVTAVVYEVVPMYSRLLNDVLALRLAQRLRAVGGDAKSRLELEREYVSARKTLRSQLERVNGICGDHFEHDTDSPE